MADVTIGYITVESTFSLKDLANLQNKEIMAMQYLELRPFARDLFKAANQRYSRLEKLDLAFTPALDAVNDSGGKFYVSKYPADEPKFINQLRSEVMRAKRFIEMKTSTVSAARKFDAKMKETIGGDVTRDSGAKVWELFRKAEQENFAGIQMYGSDNVAQMIYNSMEKMDDDAILQYIKDVVKQEYETATEEMEKALSNSTSRFRM